MTEPPSPASPVLPPGGGDTQVSSPLGGGAGGRVAPGGGGGFQSDRDETERTTYLERKGFRVVRFTNKEVAMDLDIVVATIQELIAGH